MKNRKTIITLGLIIILLIILYFGYSIINYRIIRKLYNDEYYFDAYLVNQTWLIDFGNFDNDDMLKFYDIIIEHTAVNYEPKNIVKVPDLIGISCAEVAYALENINLKYEIKYIDDPKNPYNTVLKTVPIAKEQVETDSTITLYVNSYYNSFGSDTDLMALNREVMVENGGWIYFINNDDIYKSRIDLTSRSVVYKSLKTDGFRIEKVLTRNNNIYIFKKGRKGNILLEYNLISNQEKIIYQGNIDGIRLTGNNIFFIEFDMEKGNHTYFSLDLNNNSISEVSNGLNYLNNGDGTYYYAKVYNEKFRIYKTTNLNDNSNDEEIYSTDRQIYSFFSINNEIIVKILDDDSDSIEIINIANDEVLFSDQGSLYINNTTCKWGNKLLVFNRILEKECLVIYNPIDDRITNVEIPDEIIDSFFYYYYVLGNYIYSYNSYDTIGGYRYNLITNEFEHYQ